MQLGAELRGSARRPSDKKGTLKNLHFFSKEIQVRGVLHVKFLCLSMNCVMYGIKCMNVPLSIELSSFWKISENAWRVTRSHQVTNPKCSVFWVPGKEPLGSKLSTARQRVLENPISGFCLNCMTVEMANKPVPVGIARTRPRFDGESPH